MRLKKETWPDSSSPSGVSPFAPADGAVPDGWRTQRVCSCLQAVLSSVRTGLAAPALLHAQFGLPLVGRSGVMAVLSLAVAAPEIRDCAARAVGLAAAFVLGGGHSAHVVSGGRRFVWWDAVLGEGSGLLGLCPLALFFFPSGLILVWLLQACAAALLGVFATPAKAAVFYEINQGTSPDPAVRGELKRVVANQDAAVALLRLPLQFAAARQSVQWSSASEGDGLGPHPHLCAAFVAVSLLLMAVRCFRIHSLPTGDETKKMKKKNANVDLPADQGDNAVGPFWALVLPKGFPASVSADYLDYQLYDTIQVMCNLLRDAIIGPLVTALALMPLTTVSSSSGSGNESAESSIMVVVGLGLLQEMIKNTSQLVAGTVFTSEGSAESFKTWRMRSAVAALISSVLLTLEAWAPGDAGARIRLGLGAARLSLAAVMATLGAGSGTALVLHLARHNTNASFAAEVAAKEENQDRVVGLLFVALRFGAMMMVGTNVGRALGAVVVLSVLHIAFNLMSMRALRTSQFEREFSWCGIGFHSRTAGVATPTGTAEIGGLREKKDL